MRRRTQVRKAHAWPPSAGGLLVPGRPLRDVCLVRVRVPQDLWHSWWSGKWSSMAKRQWTWRSTGRTGLTMWPRSSWSLLRRRSSLPARREHVAHTADLFCVGCVCLLPFRSGSRAQRPAWGGYVLSVCCSCCGCWCHCDRGCGPGLCLAPATCLARLRLVASYLSIHRPRTVLVLCRGGVGRNPAFSRRPCALVVEAQFVVIIVNVNVPQTALVGANRLGPARCFAGVNRGRMM